MTKEQIQNILKYHSQGFSNRKIARLMQLNHATVGYTLKNNNLKPNQMARSKIILINSETVKCSKCNEEKYIEEFQKNRVNTPYEYRFSYCNLCRKNQNLKNINSDKFKVLEDTYRRTLQRCKRKNIYSDITFDYIKFLYEKQKGKCFYSEIEFNIVRGIGQNPNGCTIDRVNPNLGYIKGNLVLSTKRFNTIKSNLQLNEIKIHMPNWHNKIINTEWLTNIGDF